MFPLDHRVSKDPSVVGILGKALPCLFTCESRTALPLIHPMDAIRQVPSLTDAIDQIRRDDAVPKGEIVI